MKGVFCVRSGLITVYGKSGFEFSFVADVILFITIDCNGYFVLLSVWYNFSNHMNINLI